MAEFIVEKWIAADPDAGREQVLREATAAAIGQGLEPTGQYEATFRPSDPTRGETPDGWIMRLVLAIVDTASDTIPGQAAAFSPDELLDVALDSGPGVCAQTGRHTFTPADSDRMRHYQEATALCQVCGGEIAGAALAASAGLVWRDGAWQ